MRISYDGLWALYYGSIWTQSEQSMKLAMTVFTDQLGKYFEKLGISTKVLDQFKSLSQPIITRRNSHNINLPKHIDKASPFCKKIMASIEAIEIMFKTRGL